MIPFRCRLMFHHWPKWQHDGVMKVQLVHPVLLGERIDKPDEEVQSRECPDCGRIQRRRVTV